MENISDKTIKSNLLTDKEYKFIDEYLKTGNATQAVIVAGFETKSPSRYASDLLRKEKVGLEIQKMYSARASARIASATEILQFYTSVMRGEVLDQFGIEASLDTRLKAANEMAKHQIEIPMKLEQKNSANAVGSVQINFLPRKSAELPENA